MIKNKKEGILPLSAVELLALCIGKRLTHFARYSLAPKTQFAEKTGFRNAHAFSMAEGPVGFGFDDDMFITLTTSEELASVLVYSGAESQSFIGNDDYDPIDAADPDYSESHMAEFLSRKVKRVGVFWRSSKNDPAPPRPYQIALTLSFEGGKRLAAGLRLLDNSNRLAVAEYSEISRETRRNYVDITIARKCWLPKWPWAAR